jgi:hypothetical protein
MQMNVILSEHYSDNILNYAFGCNASFWHTSYFHFPSDVRGTPLRKHCFR